MTLRLVYVLGAMFIAASAGVVAATAVRPQSAGSLQIAQALFPEVPGATSNERFGVMVDVDADRFVVGAPRTGTNNDIGGGSVYVYERLAAGDFVPTRVRQQPPQDYDRFGYQVALSGDYLAVSGYVDGFTEQAESAVFIFRWTGSDWTQSQVLRPSTPEPSGFDPAFGQSIAMDGDRLAVGAIGADIDGVRNAGAVYVFERNGQTWFETAKLTSTTPTVEGGLGWAVDIHADRIAAGPANDDRFGQASGAVFVFEWVDSEWVQAVIGAPELEEGSLGRSVAVDGDRIVAGAPDSREILPGLGSQQIGAAVVFTRTATGWTHEVVRAPHDQTQTQFGSSVALSGEVLLVGAPRWDVPGRTNNTGTVYRFDLSGATQSQVVLEHADMVRDEENFGSSVGLSATVMVAGAMFEHHPDLPDLRSGGARVLEFVLDSVPPTVLGVPDRSQNGAGWYNSPVTVGWDVTDPEPSSGVVQFPPDRVAATEGTVTYVSGPACDAVGNCATGEITLSIDLTAPVVGDVGLSLNPLVVGSSTVLSAEIFDATSGVDAAEYSIDGGPAQLMTLSGSTATETIGADLTAGVYQVDVRAQDVAGNWSNPASVILVVYDPSGGFVTGGGWIVPSGSTSDAGDALPGLDSSSKANFGFNVKYRNGQATVPSGHLLFQYSVGDFRLTSGDFEWLVVTNSNWAKFRGLAEIDGMDGPFPFTVDARDGNQGQADRFVIKIWAPGDNPDANGILYKASGDLDGGNIKIHVD